MTLEDLGYDQELEAFRKQEGLDAFAVGRVVAEHKERYLVRTADKEYEAEIIGNLRFTAQERADFPAVGDWVAITEYDEDKALIHAVFPRKTIIERQAVGKKGEKQIIAANIDYAFIVQAADRDFNINRIERYLTICHTAGVDPIIVLNKIDLIGAEVLTALIRQVQERVKDVPVLAISNATHQGYEALEAMILPGKTYCLLGSSGVGKSTLVNQLAGEARMKTNAISSSTGKGRHVTSHRELTVLESGGLLIDNPGMREVGTADAAGGLETTFEPIIELAKKCKFKDCTHTRETGCAVLEALENGEIDQATYDNYQKLQREQQHYESTVAERRKKEREMGKLYKLYKKGKYKQ